MAMHRRLFLMKSVSFVAMGICCLVLLSPMTTVAADLNPLRSFDAVYEFGRQSRTLPHDLLNNRRQSSCWTATLAELPTICAHFDENGRKSLGLQLAACHLEDAGVKMPACPQLDPDECIAALASYSLVFETYTKYYLHGIALCYVYETERIKNVINEEVADLLLSAQVTSKLLENIEQRIDAHPTDQAQATELVARFFANFQWLQSRLDVLEELLRSVSQNVDLLQGAGFYLAVGIVAMVASAYPATAAARFWMLVGEAVALAVESLLRHLITASATSRWVAELLPWCRASTVSVGIGYLRGSLLGFLVLASLIAAVSWRDTVALNRSLLKRMLVEVELSRRRLYPSRSPAPPTPPRPALTE